MWLTTYLEGAKALRFFDGVCMHERICIRHNTAANVAGPKSHPTNAKFCRGAPANAN